MSRVPHSGGFRQGLGVGVPQELAKTLQKEKFANERRVLDINYSRLPGEAVVGFLG